MGVQIHGAGQCLLQQGHHVQTDFRGDIDPGGREDVLVIALAHIFILILAASLSLRRAALLYRGERPPALVSPMERAYPARHARPL
jgi:hypothetical protein